MVNEQKNMTATGSFHEIEKRVRDWVSTADAKAKLSEAYKIATQANRDAERARQVQPRDLSEPFTL